MVRRVSEQDLQVPAAVSFAAGTFFMVGTPRQVLCVSDPAPHDIRPVDGRRAPRSRLAGGHSNKGMTCADCRRGSLASRAGSILDVLIVVAECQSVVTQALHDFDVVPHAVGVVCMDRFQR